MASENVVELNDSNFDTVVSGAPEPLLVDESPAVSDKFGIRSIPTLLFFKGGVKRDQTVGILGKAEIVRRLEALA